MRVQADSCLIRHPDYDFSGWTSIPRRPDLNLFNEADRDPVRGASEALTLQICVIGLQNTMDGEQDSIFGLLHP